MPIVKRITSKKRYLRADVETARAALGHFTKAQPMMVSQNMYDAIVKTGEMNDMLDRLRVQKPIPSQYDC